QRVAPYQRHAEAFGMQYGPDDAVMPAVGALGGSSTATGPGLVQVIPIDIQNEKLGAVDPMKLYQVSKYSDVAMLQARGKRNPSVPPGPSPVATPPAQGGPTPTNPGVQSTGTSDGTGDMPSVPSTPSGTGPHAPGFGQTDTQAAGCACTTAPGSSSTSGIAGF